MGAISVQTGTLAAVKLIKVLKTYGPTKPIPIICLSLTLIASMERLLFVVDPMFAYGIFPFIIGNILMTGSMHITLISILVLIFHWAEFLKDVTAPPSAILKKIRVPMGVCCSIIFIMEVISAFFRGLYYDAVSFKLMIVISGILYVVCGLGVSIFYFVTSIRLIVKLFKSGDARMNEMSRGKLKVFAFLLTR